MTQSLQTRFRPMLLAGIPLFLGAMNGPAIAMATADEPPAPSTQNGNFLSTITQAFKQDLSREVVHGHFDVDTPSGSHRYYCLIDPKTGRREVNGVGGEPFVRPDGMTGLKSGATSFQSCVTAEQQGLLITTGYVLSAGASAALAKVPAPPATAPPAPTAQPTNAPAPVMAMDAAVQTDVMAVFARFVAGQNSHDGAAVSEVLLDSKDFVWAQGSGSSVWGHQDAMAAFQHAWRGTWKLDPQLNEMHIGKVAPGIAVLTTPLLFTQGESGAAPSTTPVRWAGVFVRTASAWRISSIMITPFPAWQPPN